MPVEVLAIALRLRTAGYSVKKASAVCAISELSLRQAAATFAETGSVRVVVPPAPKVAGAGTARLGQAGEAFLLELRRINPGMYLREYVTYMRLAGFSVKKSAVGDTLKRLRMTRKKVIGRQ